MSEWLILCFFFFLITDAMAATLPLPGISGPRMDWSLEAFITPTLVSALCKTHKWCCVYCCSFVTQTSSLQVAVLTPSPPVSTMWMAADLPAAEKVERHLGVSSSVKLDTPPATKRISTMVKKKCKKTKFYIYIYTHTKTNPGNKNAMIILMFLQVKPHTASLQKRMKLNKKSTSTVQ